MTSGRREVETGLWSGSRVTRVRLCVQKGRKPDAHPTWPTSVVVSTYPVVSPARVSRGPPPRVSGDATPAILTRSRLYAHRESCPFTGSSHPKTESYTEEVSGR